MYTTKMKYDWNPEKNEWLKKERKVSFEDVVFHLSQGDVWKVADHPEDRGVWSSFLTVLPKIKKCQRPINTDV